MELSRPARARDEAPLDPDRLAEVANRLEELSKAIVGQQRVIREILIAFLAGGHCLLRGVPGLAKTLLIKTLAEAVDLKFNRIQFAPALMPSDNLGAEVERPLFVLATQNPIEQEGTYPLPEAQLDRFMSAVVDHLDRSARPPQRATCICSDPRGG